MCRPNGWDVVMGRSVHQYLDQLYAEFADSPLAELCDRVDLAVDQLTKEAVYSQIDSAARAARISFVVGPNDHFLLGDEWFEFRLSDRVPRELVLTLDGVEPGSRLERPTVTGRVDGFGRFRRIRVRTHRRFSRMREAISQSVLDVLQGAYRWENEWLPGAACPDDHQSADAAYSLVYKILPQALANEVWLYVADDVSPRGSCRYLVTPRRIRHAADAATRQELRTTRSPLALVADFSSVSIDWETAFAREALAVGRALPASLTAARYSESGLDFAERAVYGGVNIVVHPLVATANSVMIAAYPLSMKEGIEEALDAERVDFAQLPQPPRRKASGVGKTIGSLADGTARLAGQFVGGQLNLPRYDN